VTDLPAMWDLPMRMGWSVIPLQPRDKKPALLSWKAYQAKHAGVAEVKRWAASGNNIGIVTGSISGLLVLDLDNATAIAEAERLGLPDTVIASTAKGRHHYFRHPGDKVKNRAGIIPGADIRADGGFVVAPGSTHPSGVLYEWIIAPDGSQLAEAPAWLIDLLAAPASPMPPHRPQEARSARWTPAAGDCSRYGLAALERESDAIRRAYKGEQEKTLNTAALRIGALVAGNELSVSTARVNLIRAGMCMANYDGGNLWTLEAITAKVDRAMADGSAHPRSAPVGIASHG
jgi:putative DNA primase/helicase